MSLIADAELAASAGTPWGWLRIAWKLGPFVVIAGLLTALLSTCSALDHVRMQAKVDVATGARDAAEQKAGWADAGRTAADAYAAKVAALQPVVVQSTHEVDRYAQTPAGAALCAAPARVSGIDALDATLWPPGAAAGGSPAMPADPGAPAVRR